MICKNCGTRMVRDTSKVLTSIPPQYEYKCAKCGCMAYGTIEADWDDDYGQESIEDILTGKNEKPTNAVEQMIGFLTSPIARRKGVTISSDDCAVWADELKNFLAGKEPTPMV